MTYDEKSRINTYGGAVGVYHRAGEWFFGTGEPFVDGAQVAPVPTDLCWAARESRAGALQVADWCEERGFSEHAERLRA